MNGSKFLTKLSQDIGALGNFGSTHESLDTEVLLSPRVAFVMSRVDQFTRLIYERDEAGIFIHLVNGNSIARGLPVPWGANGGRYGLTRGDRDIVSLWLKTERARGSAPFFYASPSRRWYVDVVRYPTVDSALSWLSANGLTVKKYALVRNQVRGNARAGMQ